MSEAIKLILDYAFNQLGLVRVQARVHRPNEASSLLLKKCGFTYEGAWRKASWKNDDWHDFLWYSILDDEYRQ
jgi:RimJ/RimL family protein N-acetyltransferase